MPKPKCATCGSEMLETHSRNGVSIFICGHVKFDTTKRISGMPLYNEIYCNQKRSRNSKMAKSKCRNCGSKMLETYTTSGMKIMLCPHIKADITKTVSGTPLYLAIYCKLNIQGLRASFRKLAGNSVTVQELRQATNETVDTAKLLEQANVGLMLGLPADELATLFKCATQLGYATGISTAKAIEALCKGVGRRSRLILDNIGIAFKATEAYDWYKREHNLEKLDRDQKYEAWQKYALKLIKQKASRLAT